MFRSASAPYRSRYEHIHPQQGRRNPIGKFTDCMCLQAGRADLHQYLSKCSYLPKSDRDFMGKVCQISGPSPEELDDTLCKHYESTTIKWRHRLHI